MSGCSSPANTGEILSLSTEGSQTTCRSRKVNKLHSALKSTSVSVSILKNLCWGGIYFNEHRVQAWKLILEYVPVDEAQRAAVLGYKRKEYARLVEVFYNPGLIDPREMACIQADVPRIQNDAEIMQKPETTGLIVRVLGLWSARNPVPGYTSGLHEVCGLLTFAFLRDFYARRVVGREDCSIEDLEADIFWCFSAVAANFQDFYTAGSPGLQRALIIIEDLLKRKEPALMAHFADIDFNLMYLGHRWLKCLFTMEFPVHLALQVWDTFLCDEDPETSVTYLASALILRYRQQLLSGGLEQVLLLTRNLGTDTWTDEDVLTLASEAFSLQSVFAGSKLHFRS